MSTSAALPNTHDIRDIIDASSLLRNGIQETPGLTLVGDSLLNVVAFTIVEHPSLIRRLGTCLRDEGWHLRVLNNPSALQICLTNPMTVRVHELMRVIREKFFLVIHGHKLGVSASLPSANCTTYPNPAGLQAVKHQDVMLTHLNIPIFKRYTESSLMMLFSNVCGR